MPNSYKNVWTLSPCRGPNSGVAFGAGGSKSPVRCPWIGWPGDLPVPPLPSLLSVAPPGRWRISAQPFAMANISARSSLSEITLLLSLFIDRASLALFSCCFPLKPFPTSYALLFSLLFPFLLTVITVSCFSPLTLFIVSLFDQNVRSTQGRGLCLSVHWRSLGARTVPETCWALSRVPLNEWMNDDLSSVQILKVPVKLW